MTDNALMSQIAEDYYLNKLSFGEIAQKYQLSRYLINKYLSKAVEYGIVKIEIAASADRNAQLEQIFKDQFHGVQPYIIQDAATPVRTTDLLSNYAANLVVQHLQDSNHIVGMTWGDTVYSMVDSISCPPINNIKFTQFLGENMRYNSNAGSVRIVERAAKKMAGEFLTLPAPLYIANDQVRTGLYQDDSLSTTLNLAQRMDTILTAVGTADSLYTIDVWQKQLSQIFPTVDFDNVAGFIYGRPYDINGHFLNDQSDKVVGVSLANILQVPKRICLVHNPHKKAAIIGALKGQLITDLVLNESLAYEILNADA
ncbi:hypothetical protein OZX65_04235 [Leuconostocaceae bacterium ESL0723]|nr:hypothetical protein OZX65_04235 [Leuconostocaceae bacterium ESL0723]